MAASIPGTESNARIRSLIPARIDRLPWSRFHTRMVVALGVAWVLDGLEITDRQRRRRGPDRARARCSMSSTAVGAASRTVYLLGEVFGALLFGRLSDRWAAGTCSYHPRRLPGRQRA